MRTLASIRRVVTLSLVLFLLFPLFAFASPIEVRANAYDGVARKAEGKTTKKKKRKKKRRKAKQTCPVFKPAAKAKTLRALKSGKKRHRRIKRSCRTGRRLVRAGSPKVIKRAKKRLRKAKAIRSRVKRAEAAGRIKKQRRPMKKQVRSRKQVRRGQTIRPGKKVIVRTPKIEFVQPAQKQITLQPGSTFSYTPEIKVDGKTIPGPTITVTVPKPEPSPTPFPLPGGITTSKRNNKESAKAMLVLPIGLILFGILLLLAPPLNKLENRFLSGTSSFTDRIRSKLTKTTNQNLSIHQRTEDHNPTPGEKAGGRSEYRASNEEPGLDLREIDAGSDRINQSMDHRSF